MRQSCTSESSEESGDEKDAEQQLRQEVPELISTLSSPQPGPQLTRDNASGEEPREGDLDVMSATSTASGHVHTSVSSASQQERRAQIDLCWCNIPDMFVDPAGRAAYYWMALVTMAVIYNWVVIILRVAFEDMRDDEIHQRAFRVMDLVSDVIYLMDVAIQSRTAYLEDGCLVRSLPETVRHYRQQPYFVLDVLSVVPVTTLHSYLYKLGLSPNFGSSSLTTPGLRVLRLLKYPSMIRFFEKTDSRTNNPNLLRAFKLSLHLWLVIHWIGCFYYLLSQYEGLGTNEWVYPNTTEYSAFSRKYIFCMYWSTMTLTTIGERPWPATDVEHIFTGFTFLIGVFVFAAVVGNVGDVISNMNAARHDFQARMDQIKFYLNHRHVPEHLQDQIKRWAEYTWARTKAIDEPSVLQLLPSRLRTEVAIHVHLRTLKKVRIFDQCEEGLLRELVLKLRPSIYSPGEYICRIGEIGREMYIIDHGKVEILFPEQGSGRMKQVAIMTPGNYFGEISLLKLDEGQNKRTADVRSIGFSELLCLSRKDLMAALMEYPEAKKILEAQARQRMEQTKCPPKSPGDSSQTSSPEIGSVHGYGRRSARALFTEVMRQEGFTKLLSSAASQELSEMRQILSELREIKSHLFQTATAEEYIAANETVLFTGQLNPHSSLQLKSICNVHQFVLPMYQAVEQKLQEQKENLQNIRSQLLMQPSSISSNQTSPAKSVGTDAVDLSSESSNVASPVFCRLLTASQPVPTSQATGCVNVPSCNPPLPTKPYGDASLVFPPRDPSEKSVVTISSDTSTHKERPANPKAPTPFSHSHTLHNVRFLPSSYPRVTSLNSQWRQSHLATIPKLCGEKNPQTEITDKIVQDTDDLALPARLKTSMGKYEEVEESRRVYRVKSDSSTSVVKVLSPPGHSVMNSCSPLGSAVGSRSSFEIVTPSCVGPLDGQPGPKERAVTTGSDQAVDTIDSSDSFKSVISESDASSQNTSCTDTSTTSTSSGGRGHSPKPAKPKPKYPRKKVYPENSIVASPQNSGQGKACDHNELNKESTALRETNEAGGNCMPSEGFCKESVSSSQKCVEASISVNNKNSADQCLNNTTLLECKNTTEESGVDKHNQCEDDVKSENTKLESESRTLEGKTGSEAFSKNVTEETHGVQIFASKLQNSSNMPVTEREQSSTCIGRLGEEQTNTESTEVEATAGTEEDSCNTEGDAQKDTSNDAADGDGKDDNLIMATRVQSGFDKRLSKKELETLSRVVTCRKIDDRQLSILLAKRREVNDSAGNVVQSPDRRNTLMGIGSTSEPGVEHGHSVCSVTDIPESTKQIHTEKSAAPNTVEQVCQQKTDQVNESAPYPRYGQSSPADEIKINNNDVFRSPPASATLKPRGIYSVYEDVVFTEQLPTESADCNKSARKDPTVCSSEQELKNEVDGNRPTGSENKQNFLRSDTKCKIYRTGSESSSAIIAGERVDGQKTETCPVSILKKSQSEIRPGCQGDVALRDTVYELGPLEKEGQNKAPPENITDDQHPVKDENCHPNRKASTNEGSGALTSDAVVGKSDFLSALRSLDIKINAVESKDAISSTTRKSKRNRNLVMNLHQLNNKYDIDQNTRMQLESAGPQSLSCFPNLSKESQDASPTTSLTEVAQNAQEEENQEESLSTLRRQYSASRYRRRSIDQTQDPTNVSCPPVSQNNVEKGHVLIAGTPKIPFVAKSSPASASRKHSEKLNSLIMTFDHPKKKHDREASKSPEAKNGSVINAEVERMPTEQTEKSRRVNETVSGKKSLRISHPRPLLAEKKSEIKEVSSSSLSSTPVSSFSQKRKTLRRRSLTHRTRNTSGKKDTPLSEKNEVPHLTEGTGIATSTSQTENQMAADANHEDQSGSKVSTSVTLLKRLVWEEDVEKKLLTDSCREHPFASTIDDNSQLSEMFDVETNINCCLGLSAETDSLFSDNSIALKVSPTNTSDNLLSFHVNRSGNSEENEWTDSFSHGGNSLLPNPVTIQNYNVCLPEQNMLSTGYTVNCSPSVTAYRLQTDMSLDTAEKSADVGFQNVSGSLCEEGPSLCSVATKSIYPVCDTHKSPAGNLIKEPALFVTQDKQKQCSSSLTQTILTDTGPNMSCCEVLPDINTHHISQTMKAAVGKQRMGSEKAAINSVAKDVDRGRSTSVSEAAVRSSPKKLKTQHSPAQSTDKRGSGASEVNCSKLIAGGGKSAESRQPENLSVTQSRYSAQSENELHSNSLDNSGQPLNIDDEESRAESAQRSSSDMEVSTEQVKGCSTVEEFHLHPSLCSSEGVRSTQSSTGEGEVEQRGSLILLADFGVRDDDEGALSDVSGCSDQSDITSDLDDM